MTKQQKSLNSKAIRKSKSTPQSAPEQTPQGVDPHLILQRALATPSSAPRPADILALQRSSGNRVVNRLLAQRAQLKANTTGLPDTLKAGVEHLSGMPLDDVKVHYNSAKPAEVDALAYTQGTDIHMGPGQEKFLAHEAWHVVQQKQGRVAPTRQMKNAALNDDRALEREADVFGPRAARLSVRPSSTRAGEVDPAWLKSLTPLRSGVGQRSPAGPIQRVGNIMHFALLMAGWIAYSLYKDYQLRQEDYTKVIVNIPQVSQEIFNAAKEASGATEVDSSLIQVVAEGSLAERNMRMNQVRSKLSYIGLWLSKYMKSRGLTYAELYTKYHKEGDTAEVVNMKIISGAGKANPDLVGKFLGKLGLIKKSKL